MLFNDSSLGAFHVKLALVIQTFKRKSKAFLLSLPLLAEKPRLLLLRFVTSSQVIPSFIWKNGHDMNLVLSTSQRVSPNVKQM